MAYLPRSEAEKEQAQGGPLGGLLPTDRYPVGPTVSDPGASSSAGTQGPHSGSGNAAPAVPLNPPAATPPLGGVGPVTGQGANPYAPVGLYHYIDANKGAGAGMAGTIAGNVDQTGKTASDALDRARNDFKTGLEKETDRLKGMFGGTWPGSAPASGGGDSTGAANGNANGLPSPPPAQPVWNYAWEGPNNITEVDSWGNAAAGIRDTGRDIGMMRTVTGKDSSGTKSLLERAYGATGNAYTPGMARLDAGLIGDQLHSKGSALQEKYRELPLALTPGTIAASTEEANVVRGANEKAVSESQEEYRRRTAPPPVIPEAPPAPPNRLGPDEWKQFPAYQKLEAERHKKMMDMAGNFYDDASPWGWDSFFESVLGAMPPRPRPFYGVRLPTDLDNDL